MYSHYNLLDPPGVYVIDRMGNLKWLEAPFSACCLHRIGIIMANELVYVEDVATSREGEIVYIIDNLPYFYYYFAVDSSY